MSELVIHNIGQLVTMSGQDNKPLGLQGKCAIHVRDHLIFAVGSSDSVLSKAGKDAMLIDAGKKLVTPGLIDVHTHAVFAACRSGEFEQRCTGTSYQEIAASGGGIKRSMRAVREASLAELFKTTERNMNWMMRCGTTTAEVKTGYGLNLPAEKKMLDAMTQASERTGLEISKTLLALHAVPPDFGSKDEYVDYCFEELMPELVNRVDSLDMFCEEGYFDASDATRLSQFAKLHSKFLRMHVDQMVDSGGAALAASLGAKSADHLEYTSQNGIEALRASNTIPVLLPASVIGLAKSKYPDARSMIEVGLKPVLATDFNPGSSPCPSLPAVMFLGMTQMKMTAEEVLAATTVNAAKALDKHDSIGKIEPGMQADVVIWDCDDYHELPYWLGAPLANTVIKNGKPIG